MIRRIRKTPVKAARTAVVAALTAVFLILGMTTAQAFTQYYQTRTINMRSTFISGTAVFVDTGIGPATAGGTNVYASAYFQQGTLTARTATIRLTYYGASNNALCYFSGNISAGQTFAHNCGAYGIKAVRVFQDINYDDLNGTYSDFYPIP